MEEIFIGKNKSTKWRKTTFRVSQKTKKINFVRVPTGLSVRARDIKNELDAFFQIIDLSMIDDFLKYTNMYINQLKVNSQYSRDRDCKNLNRIMVTEGVEARITTFKPISLRIMYIKLEIKESYLYVISTLHIVSLMLVEFSANELFNNFLKVLTAFSAAPFVAG
ncbi:hypothetical protein RN001_008872 [Aquatica leii]|uniref:Uncharacterized protein n=1 Tax=Aquatica leii TaxID=1421715 RepID=A0AAN7S9X0_9COLE|nr:hypothetical protein RN001_008872 [Aquatica leii]